MWKKGIHESEEHKKKISEILKEGYAIGKYINPMKGKQRSEEIKRKTSETLLEGYRTGKYISPNIGKVPWNKGKTGLYVHSEETKQKMRGRIPWMKGKKHSEETLRKLSESHKGHKASEETKRKMSEQRTKEKHPLWGKHHSEESKRKMSKIRKEAFMSGRIVSPWKGKHLSDETKRKLSIANSGKNNYNYGKHFSPEHRKKQSISALKNWQNEDIAKKRIESFNLKPNGMELYLDSILQNHFPDEWKFVGDGQVIIGGLCPDFINVNGKKKIIELFGAFWHDGELALRGVSSHRTEEGKKKVYGEIGYDTLVIWDDELDNESKVIEKINRFLFDTR
jgi:hypothetical protein